jgi:hypothetical protein
MVVLRYPVMGDWLATRPTGHQAQSPRLVRLLLGTVLYPKKSVEEPKIPGNFPKSSAVDSKAQRFVLTEFNCGEAAAE